MGYEMAKPDGAFYLFIKAPGGDAGYFSRRAMQKDLLVVPGDDAVLFSEAAKAKDLLVVPGDGFGCPGYFRICYCVSLDLIERSLPIFKALIEE